MSANFTASSYCLDTLSYKTKSHGPIMPSGHYKKVIDPRTRAEVAPEVVPFWHLKIKGLEEMESTDPYFAPEPGNDLTNAEKNNAQNQEKIQRQLQKIDRTSFVLSLVAFVITLIVFVASDDIEFDTKAQLLSEEIAFVKKEDPLFVAHATYSHVMSIGVGLTTNQTDSCLKDWTPAVICRNYTKVNSKSPVMLGLPEIIATDTYVYLLPTISFILLFSAYIQFERWRKNALRDSYDRISGYFPAKPDFWRWFEYACTSPFQILLISASLLIVNWTLLLALFALQFALIWFGFLIEKRINKLYKSQKVYSHTKVFKVFILLASAWFCFVIIWIVLISRLTNSDKNVKKCAAYDDGIPLQVWFLVMGQFGCFLAFGCLQTFQVFRAVQAYQNKDENKSTFDKDERAITWLKYTRGYSVLSVTSKLFLDITLIIFVSMNSKVTCDMKELTK